MKKVYLSFIAICLWIGAIAQNGYEDKFMRFYLPDCTGSPFPISVDTYLTVSEQEKFFIKIHANFSYNAVEFPYFQKYAIPKGSNIYLKLDDEDVITLTCYEEENIKDGFITTENGVYQNYAGHSYFPIDEDMINKLKSHNIVKIRGQFKSEIMDGSLQFTPDANMPETKENFIKAEQVVLSKYNTAKNKSGEQKILEQNPLYNF